MPSEPISATRWKPQAATTAARLQRALGGNRVRASSGNAASSKAINASGSFDARIAGQLNHGGLPYQVVPQTWCMPMPRPSTPVRTVSASPHR